MSSTAPAPDFVRNVRLWSHPADSVDLRIEEGTISSVHADIR